MALLVTTSFDGKSCAMMVDKRANLNIIYNLQLKFLFKGHKQDSYQFDKLG